MLINKKELLDALAIANRVVEKKSSMAILSCVRIDGKSCTMQATDLDVGVTIPLEISQSDELFTLSARRITDIVRSLDADDVEILALESTEETPRENWVGINGLFEISGYDADEFPQFEIPETTGYATIGKTPLQNILPAVCKDADSGFKLNGVYFDADQGKSVATDGHRLHLEPIEVDGGSFMMPIKALRNILSSLGKDEDEITFGTVVQKIVEKEGSGEPPEKTLLTGLNRPQLCSLAEDYFDITFDDEVKVPTIKKTLMDKMVEASKIVYRESVKNAVVKTEAATFVVRTLETRFPDYASIVPENPAHVITVKRGEFLAAVEQSLTMANERYKAVKLTFNGKGTIEMQSVNPDIGNYQRLTVPMSGHVDPAVEAGYNPAYLRDIMNVTKDNDAEFEVGVNSESLPLTFKLESFEGLVMPMRV